MQAIECSINVLCNIATSVNNIMTTRPFLWFCNSLISLMTTHANFFFLKSERLLEHFGKHRQGGNYLKVIQLKTFVTRQLRRCTASKGYYFKNCDIDYLQFSSKGIIKLVYLPTFECAVVQAPLNHRELISQRKLNIFQRCPKRNNQLLKKTKQRTQEVLTNDTVAIQ